MYVCNTYVYTYHYCSMFDMLMWTIVASQGGVTWSVSHWSQIKNCVQDPPRGGC